jgi:hypothetical protein
MKKVAFAVLALGLVPAPYVAALEAGNDGEAGWKKELVANLNLMQAGFDNWAQGGENTLGWQSSLDGTFTQSAPRRNWATTVNLAYGMQKVGSQEARKSVDELKLGTVYTFKLGLFVDPYAAFTAQTQFSRGYRYEDDSKTPVSDFLDPGYFTESVGVGRSYQDILTSRMGFAVKETVSDDFAYADDPDTENEVEESRVDLGLESVTNLSVRLDDNLLFTSELDLFSDLEATNRIDVDWDNTLSAEISKYVNVGLNVTIFYDRDISKKRQIKESLTLGLTYAFF